MRHIDVETLRSWLEEGRAVTLLDVRTKDAFEESHIPGSIHVDAYHALKSGDPEALRGVEVAADRPVVTVCGVGHASGIAAEQLEVRGVDVLSLDGGMRAWGMAWNHADVSIPRSPATVIQIRRTAKGCLSYIIASDGIAAVIDPSLPPEVYANLCRQRSWTIRRVVETHVHADHISRAKALAELVRAEALLPQTERAKFEYAAIAAGQRMDVGRSTLTALGTPGHTPESMTYVLDGAAAFTGDTLFVAGVGRPDLHNNADQTKQAARRLYHSVQNVMALGPDTLILPGHATPPVPFDRVPVAATASSIRSRVPLLSAGEDRFISALVASVAPTPPNYEAITRLNESGVMPADPSELEVGANRCAAVQPA